MADVAQHAGEQRTGGERVALALEHVAEHAAEAKHGKGNEIVEQQNGDDRAEAHAHDVFDAEEQLEQTVDKPGEQSPAGAVAIGDQQDRQHTGGGDTAAVGQLEQLDQAQDGGKRDHQRALRQADNRIVLHINRASL